MAVYVAEYRQELTEIGAERFARIHHRPVLVVTGFGGTLSAPAATGTLVTSGSDMMMLGTLIGRVFPLVKGKYSTPGPVVVGRTSDNDVVINEYSISKRHCSLAVVGADVRLTDWGSTNGTSVNGVRLTPQKAYALSGGEAIGMGRFALSFHHPAGFIAFLRSAP